MENKEFELLLDLLIKKNGKVKKGEEFSAFYHYSWLSDDWSKLYFELRNKDGDKLGHFGIYIDSFSENVEDATDVEDSGIKFLRKRENELEMYYASDETDGLEEDIRDNSSNEDYLIFDYPRNDPPCLYISEEKIDNEYHICIKVEDFLNMIYNEFRKVLLNEFKRNGREMIRDGIKRCRSYSRYSEYNLYLVCFRDGSLELRPKKNNRGFGLNDLLYVIYDFGNCQDNEIKYKNIYNELLKSGQTNLEDFEEWFDKECFLDDEIDSIYDIVKDKINQFLASRAVYLGLTSKKRDIAGLKAIKNEFKKQFEENGRELIEEGLRKYNSSYIYPGLELKLCDNLCLVFDYYNLELHFEKGKLSYPGKFDLYHFCFLDKRYYSAIHRELLVSRVTETVDFDEWFEHERCLDKEINMIYEIIKNQFEKDKIFYSQVYSDEDKEIFKINLLKGKVAEPLKYSFNSDIYIDELVVELLDYIYNEIEKEENITRRIELLEYVRIINKIMNEINE